MESSVQRMLGGDGWKPWGWDLGMGCEVLQGKLVELIHLLHLQLNLSAPFCPSPTLFPLEFTLVLALVPPTLQRDWPEISGYRGAIGQ